MKLNSFGNKEKLKSEKLISGIFQNGKFFVKGSIRTCYIENNFGSNRIAVSVPKRNFKRAVDRNRIKRLMREAYRLNKSKFTFSKYFDIMFVFTGKKLPEYIDIFENTAKALAFLSSKL